MNTEEMMKAGKRQITIVLIITDSEMDQQMPKLVSASLMNNRNLYHFEESSHKICIDYEEKPDLSP